MAASKSFLRIIVSSFHLIDRHEGDGLLAKSYDDRLDLNSTCRWNSDVVHMIRLTKRLSLMHGSQHRRYSEQLMSRIAWSCD